MILNMKIRAQIDCALILSALFLRTKLKAWY